MYGEVIGHLAPPSQTGYNGDYAARFVVEQVNMLSAENPQRCNLAATPTRAFGTEPFWNMNYTADGLTFQPLGGPKQTFKIDSSRLSANQRLYRFNDGELTLTRESCSDGMSDIVRHGALSAVASVSGAPGPHRQPGAARCRRARSRPPPG